MSSKSPLSPLVPHTVTILISSPAYSAFEIIQTSNRARVYDIKSSPKRTGGDRGDTQGGTALCVFYFPVAPGLWSPSIALARLLPTDQTLISGWSCWASIMQAEFSPFLLWEHPVPLTFPTNPRTAESGSPAAELTVSFLPNNSRQWKCVRRMNLNFQFLGPSVFLSDECVLLAWLLQ